MTGTSFAIVGCGAAALPVSQALAASPLTRLTRVYDLDQGLARDLGARCGASAAGRLEDVLEDPEVQAIYVAVPHDQLYPLARAALEAGKHTLVEKPMALTLEQADELIALAGERRLALGVFYELRHSRPYAQARELIRAGAIGKVIGVQVQTLIDKPLAYWESGYSGRSANPWRGQKARAGGGVVIMNTSHQLDAVHYVTGLEVASVSAEVGTLAAPVEVEDSASVNVRYDNGALGSIWAGASAVGARAGQDERFNVFGTRGQLKVPDAYGSGALQVYLRDGWGEVPANAWQTLPAKPARVFVEAVEAFARAAQSGEPAPTSGRDARRVLAIVLAIYRSAIERRTIFLG